MRVTARGGLSAHTVADWVWHGDTGPSRLARTALSPVAALYRVAARGRARAYQAGLLPRHRLPVPLISVGNLTVGGTGKTPVASWIAGFCVRRGFTPGIVLRGSGRGWDEGEVHRESNPSAVVAEGKNRAAAARSAVARGARILILDDGFQRLDVQRDLNILLVGAEGDPWPLTLPAGRWREPWDAARRADLIVVTRKRAGREEVAATEHRVASLGFSRERIARAALLIGSLAELRTGKTIEPDCLMGARVLAACGVGDPQSFVTQLAALGARVQLLAFPDHQAYSSGDVRRILSAARDADYVVVTQKDAVKLRRLRPALGPATLVAYLEVAWEQGAALVVERISDLLTSYYDPAHLQESGERLPHAWATH
jgi:tetraacyldisaccharide 4'-kinase